MAPSSVAAAADADAAGEDGRNGRSKEAVVAKAVGFLVFSGIALSVVKGLIPHHSGPRLHPPPPPPPPPPPTPPPPPPPEPSKVSTHKPKLDEGFGRDSCSDRVVAIKKGDTLWGLATRYGVSVDAIKQANGINGDTIYAGKKLVIP